MKLNRTREEWALNALYYRTPAPLDCYKEALEDLATLFAEVDRLTAQLAEREAECFNLAAGVCEYRSGDNNGNPLCLMVRKPIPPNMYPVTAKEPHTHVTDKGTVIEMPNGVECPLCRIARFHAAEDKSHDA